MGISVVQVHLLGTKSNWIKYNTSRSGCVAAGACDLLMPFAPERTCQRAQQHNRRNELNKKIMGFTPYSYILTAEQ